MRTPFPGSDMSDSRRPATVSYAPGEGVVLAGRCAWLLADLGLDNRLVRDLWELVDAVRPSRDLVGRVTWERIASGSIANFAMLVEHAGGVAIGLAGTAVVVVELPLGQQRTLACTSDAVETWYDLPADVGQISASLGASVAELDRILPLGAGVAQASLLELVWTSSPPEQRTALISDQRGDVAQSADAIDAAMLAGDDEDASLHQVNRTAEVSTTLEDDLDPVNMVVYPASEDGEFQDGAVGPDAPVPGSPPADEFGYDHLFGITIGRTVEEAAVRRVDAFTAPQPGDAEDDGGTPAADVLLVNSAPPDIEQPPAAPQVHVSSPPPVAPRSGMIESVPGMARASGASISPDANCDVVKTDALVNGDGVDEGDGVTMRRDSHDALLSQLASTGVVLGVPGPPIHAVRCPDGHLNAPHAGRCRSCSAPVTEQAPITVPRPALGILRLSTGDEIVLDRPVLMGRSPSVDRMISGERPHVVKLPSPGQDISRNHVEVRVDGWHVFVTDLNSTNGTVVERPNAEPERLRPANAVMIEPGTTVNLADEVSFTFIAT